MGYDIPLNILHNIAYGESFTYKKARRRSLIEAIPTPIGHMVLIPFLDL